MIRNLATKHYIGMNHDFRYRGEEPTRVEALSDAGFALSIGLLLISTSPPKTFGQLVIFTKDLLPFALCITLIMLVWHQHFIFFLRYGFRNKIIVALNTVLLFIILFYVYPLKFLMKLLVNIYTALFSGVLNFNYSMRDVFAHSISQEDMPYLMVIYGSGAAAIFIVLAAMYHYAWRKSDELKLNELEKFDTKTSVYSNLLMASVPLLSVLLALIISNPITASTISGCTYFIYFPLMVIFGKIVDKKREKRNNLPPDPASRDEIEKDSENATT